MELLINCGCVCIHIPQFECGGQRISWGSQFSFLPCGFQGLNSRLLVLPAKPSFWASHGFLIVAEGLQVLVQERFLVESFLDGINQLFKDFNFNDNFVCVVLGIETRAYCMLDRSLLLSYTHPSCSLRVRFWPGGGNTWANSVSSSMNRILTSLNWMHHLGLSTQWRRPCP